ncbi:MAG: DUF1254 domain-containing protein [Blastomonas sp.]
MMRRWIAPLAAGLGAVVLGYLGTMWFTPSLVMDRAWIGMSELAGVNHMLHAPLSNAGRRGIVRPSPDLAYSLCPFDLGNGPVLVHAEAVPDRYWSITVFDNVTNAVFTKSDRDTGGKNADVALVRSGQSVPAGIETVELPDDKGIALVRVLMHDRSEIAEIQPIRAKSFCKVFDK